MRHLRAVICGGLVGVLCALAGPPSVDAKITVRRHADADAFFFHGNYSSAPFSPSDAFGLEIWNCPDGVMPIFIADREPLVVCGYDDKTGFVLADLVYAVALPAGACKDHGGSCYFRDATVPESREGIRSFRVRYARGGHGNRVWLESFGDLTDATQANMLILITIDGSPRAVLQDTFVPIPGGWFSKY